jgi:hypothetical protein
LDAGTSDKENLQQQILRAFEILQREITAKALHDNLHYKYRQHNRSLSVRMKLLKKKGSPETASTPCNIPLLVERRPNVYLCRQVFALRQMRRERVFLPHSSRVEFARSEEI